MVCEHREGQSAECVEDSLWCQHIPVEGVVLRPELWHLSRWQIHRDGIRRQEGHRLRGHLLERQDAPASALLMRRLLLFPSGPSVCGYNTLRQATDLASSNLVGIYAAVGRRMLVLERSFFLSFVLEGLFLGYTVFLWLLNFFLVNIWVQPDEAALHFREPRSPRRLVKSVHIGLNKRHFIYIIKIYIFSCPGCTCDDFFGPLCLTVFEWESRT